MANAWESAPLVNSDSSTPAWASAPLVDQGPKAGIIKSGGHSYGRMTAQEDQPGPDLTHQLVRAGAISGRDILSGVAGLPLLAGDAATGIANIPIRMAGGQPLEGASSQFQRGLNELGGAIPGGDLNNSERLASAATRGAVGALSGAGMANQLAGTLRGTAGGVAESLAVNPGLQSASGATGAASGEVARQKGAGPGGQLVASLLGSLAPAASLTAKASLLPTKVAASSVADDTARAARADGFTIPPTQTNPSMLNKTLEGFAGKLSTAQASAVKNQSVTNQFARKALGLADDAPITPDTLSAVRQQAGQAYEAVAQVPVIQADKSYLSALANLKKDATNNVFKSLDRAEVQQLTDDFAQAQFSGKDAIEAVKQLRFDAGANRASMEPAKKALGQAQSKIAAAMEDLVDRNLASTQPSLVDAYRAARTQIAKTYTIEKALNPATGNVIASKLGKEFAKGKPLSGGLEKIGRFANAYPKAAQEITSSMPGASPLDWFAGMATSAATSNPAMMATVAARPAARSLLLSNLYQNGPGSPSGLVRPPINLQAISPGAAAITSPLERLQAQQ